MNTTLPAISTTAQNKTSAAANEVQGKNELQQTGIPVAVHPFIQRKLSVGAADDPLEKEADNMADRVMRMPMPAPLNFSTAVPAVHRKCAHCEEEENIQRKEAGSEMTTAGSSGIRDVLNSGGKPLDTDTRSFMEPRFNYDFSSVKIHNDDVAAKSAASINALAYTSGNNIVFNSGQFNTQSDNGKRLLAHELTHVVQQGSAQPSIQRKPTLTKPDMEDIAHRVRKAIEGWGTDEEAVYRALQQLEKDPAAIKMLEETYVAKYKTTPEKDIRDDFSGGELQYALELINIKSGDGELIPALPAPSSDGSFDFDFDELAGKLYKAMSGLGTDEEAIFAILFAMENNPERIKSLKEGYTVRYPKGLHGGGLEHDIRDEMSGSELDYALLLMNIPPTGNAAIIAWIRSVINARVKKDTAKGIMETINQLSFDRLSVIIIALKNASEFDKFHTNLVSVVADDFKELVKRIQAADAKFNSPGATSTAATGEQKGKITDILQQGMNVDPDTGEIAAFIDVVDGRSYERDVKDSLDKELAKRLPGATAKLALPKFDWPRYDEMANEAKKRVDALYGRYATSDALSSVAGPGQNLFDAAVHPFEDWALIQFADNLITAQTLTDPVYPGKRIMQVHNADLSREPEKTIHESAITSWMGIGSNKTQLLTLLRSWPGAHEKDETGKGKILLQRGEWPNTNKNRVQFWSTFQTMIHEYLHKITHGDYTAKARTIGEAKEKVFTEGATGYFDKRVWKTIYPDEVRTNADLRKKVEGAEFPYNSSLIQTRNAYAEQAAKFTQIVDVVGEENAAAAYFQGKTDRVGL